MVENEALHDPAVAAKETAAPFEEAPQETAVPSESPLARLILKRGGQETDEVFGFAPPATVGRFDPTMGPIEIDLGGLDEGKYVSRKHAQITCEGGVWKIRDLGSSNGTYVLRADFERIEEAELSDGDEIAFGNARFVFRVGLPFAGEPAEEVATPEPEEPQNEEQA